MISAYHAFGIVIPGWERPVLKSSIEEQDQLGHEITIGIDKTLAMNRQDGAAHATSFTFFEEHRLHCMPNTCPPIPETSIFFVTDVRTESCGSTVYFAEEMVPANLDGKVTQAPRALRVVDHRTRLCEDYKKYEWEAAISTNPTQDGNVRLFFGNPIAVTTIQTNPFLHTY